MFRQRFRVQELIKEMVEGQCFSSWFTYASGDLFQVQGRTFHSEVKVQVHEYFLNLCVRKGKNLELDRTNFAEVMEDF